MMQIAIFLILLFLVLIVLVRSFRNWIFGEDEPGQDTGGDRDKGFPYSRRNRK